MKDSRRKGKKGELQAAKELRKHLGIEAIRGRQYQGGDDSPDVKTSLQGVHFEVKRTEVFNLYAALEQATSEKKKGDVPVVLYRKNLKKWVVIVPLEDLKKLAELIYLQTE